MANKYISPGVYTRDYWIPVRKHNTLDRKIKINKIFDLKLDIYDSTFRHTSNLISDSKLNSIIK